MLERLVREPDDADLAYFVQLAAFHEQMHCEALTYTRQTLGYPRPPIACAAQPMLERAELAGDAALPGGEFWLGAATHDGFVFDNEKWRHRVDLASFSIARGAVTNAQYADFVDDGGYSRCELWSEQGWHWREQAIWATEE